MVININGCFTEVHLPVHSVRFRSESQEGISQVRLGLEMSEPRLIWEMFEVARLMSEKFPVSRLMCESPKVQKSVSSVRNGRRRIRIRQRRRITVEESIVALRTRRSGFR